jgi:predicted alpha-1,2-mannosidase
MYAYAGKQWKTAKLAREICQTMYTDQNDGLCGNEDCGQMSAWYILSSIGFYPVNPANGAYVFGSPVFDTVQIELPQGKSFTILAENNSPENIYIQTAELNGISYSKSFITHKDILNGGILKFVMGSQPNPDFGTSPENRPKSIVY